jgi:hypothetical protein
MAFSDMALALPEAIMINCGITGERRNSTIAVARERSSMVWSQTKGGAS